MAYVTKLQVIQRGGQNRQYYLICPAPMAAALEMEKGEELEWVIKDRNTFEIRRVQARAKGGPLMEQPKSEGQLLQDWKQPRLRPCRWLPVFQ